MSIIKYVLLVFTMLGMTQGFCADDAATARYDQIRRNEEMIRELEAKIAETDRRLALVKTKQWDKIDAAPIEEPAREERRLTPKEIVVAQEKFEDGESPAIAEEKVYQFQFGFETSYISYEEPDVDMTEKGPFFGIYGAFNWRPEELRSWPINVLHVDAHADYGVIKYKSPSGVATNIDDYMLEPRLWIGHDFLLPDAVRITPYVGIGYRFLYDAFGDAGPGAYDRRSQYVYAPVGFELNYKAIPGWEIGLNAEYDIFIQGWQTSFLSDNNSFWPDITNKQKKGYGLRASIDIIKKMDKIDFLVSPYVRFWHIKESEYNTAANNYFIVGGVEPENKSTEIGLKLGAQF